MEILDWSIEVVGYGEQAFGTARYAISRYGWEKTGYRQAVAGNQDLDSVLQLSDQSA